MILAEKSQDLYFSARYNINILVRRFEEQSWEAYYENSLKIGQWNMLPLCGIQIKQQMNYSNTMHQHSTAFTWQCVIRIYKSKYLKNRQKIPDFQRIYWKSEIYRIISPKRKTTTKPTLYLRNTIQATKYVCEWVWLFSLFDTNFNVSKEIISQTIENAAKSDCVHLSVGNFMPKKIVNRLSYFICFIQFRCQTYSCILLAVCSVLPVLFFCTFK